jgi:hypothetical protein
MSQDLTNSATQRQNILNNPYSLQEIEKATHIRGIAFEGVRRWIDWHAVVCRCYGETLRSLSIAGTCTMAQYRFGIFALAADGATSAG